MVVQPAVKEPSISRKAILGHVIGAAGHAGQGKRQAGHGCQIVVGQGPELVFVKDQGHGTKAVLDGNPQIPVSQQGRVRGFVGGGLAGGLGENALVLGNAFDSGAAQPPTEGTNTVAVTNGFNWQSSWFGNFYQATNSLLVDKGNRTANQVGLYHFTTRTNQMKETNSVVDIGYHYVATDTNGIPLDSNGDGIPDYLEDANGNGLVDNGETNWASPDSDTADQPNHVQGTNVYVSAWQPQAWPHCVINGGLT